MDDLDRLRTLADGELIGPEDPCYDSVRVPAQLRFRDVRPRAVLRCASAQDVSHALRFARTAGLPVVPRGGGHCFAGRSSTEGLLLDLTGLADVSVGPDARATIGAGARLATVYDRLHEHRLTIPAGCGATVGIAGLTLGGGLGLLGRRYGLTCDRLVAATVVLADGRIVTCDERREPDLFWALRGAGGGQFGVATSLVFDAVPEPTATRFVLRWADGQAPAVIAAWQDWAPDAADDVTANLGVTAASGHAGQVIVYGAVARPADSARVLLDELVTRVGAEPAAAEIDQLGYRDLKRSFAALDVGDESDQLVTSKSEFFRRSLPDTALAQLLDGLRHGLRPGERRGLNFLPMGGAYNRVPPEATAFVHRGERFLLEHVAVGMDAGWVRDSWAAAHPHASGRAYPNFPDPELTDWVEAYHGPNHARLAAVKDAYDPDGLFSFPQAVRPDGPRDLHPSSAGVGEP